MARPERLQKYIARCGAASRRAAEELILSGRVRVNKQVVTCYSFYGIQQKGFEHKPKANLGYVRHRCLRQI